MHLLLKNLRVNKTLIAILVLATALRLVGLGHPKDYIFDEVYHAFTAREYLNHNIDAWEWWTTPPEGVAYEWTHPPVAKYGIELGMWIFGENSFGWRFSSAILGVISILGLYLFVYAISSRRDLALVSAFLLTIEGTHIAQSRIAMNDIYMLCFYIWALYLAVKSRWKSASVLYGLALASKWSSLYGLIPLVVIYLYQNPIQFKLRYFIRHILQTLRLLLISLSVYILTFSPFILVGHTWQQWVELHRQMWYYHTHLVATHGYQSTPLQWIFDVRPVWYYVKYLETSIQNIYVIGNPLILWLGLVAFVLQSTKILKQPYFLLYTLYLILFLPWVFSPRIMFYYHYLPSVTFLTVILASWITSLPKKYALICLLLTISGAIFISPMLYGYTLPTSYWDTLFGFLPTWR